MILFTTDDNVSASKRKSMRSAGYTQLYHKLNEDILEELKIQ
jgi:hypothetical protein